MSSVVIAQLNDADADFIVQLIKKVHGKAKILKGKALEDFKFAQLIDDGMKSKNVPLSKLRAKLRK
jgi:HPt (histidine-containing phosphotransfer) domain-containing protein